MSFPMTETCNQTEALTKAFAEMSLSTYNLENITTCFSPPNAMAVPISCKQMVDAQHGLKAASSSATGCDFYNKTRG